MVPSTVERTNGIKNPLSNTGVCFSAYICIWNLCLCVSMTSGSRPPPTRCYINVLVGPRVGVGTTRSLLVPQRVPPLPTPITRTPTLFRWSRSTRDTVSQRLPVGRVLENW